MDLPACIFCQEIILGSAEVLRGGTLIHAHCVLKKDGADRGLLYPCPQCKRSGKVNGKETRTLEVELRKGEIPLCAFNGCRGCGDCRDGKKRVEVPIEIKCPLCEGEGYTKTEAKPVEVVAITGWKL